MKTKTKKAALNISTLVLVMFFALLTILAISRLGISFSENYQNELVALSEQLLHKEKNIELKELTLKVSPNQKKQAYFQRKFGKGNVTEIDDRDYVSVILDQGNKKEVLFQGNFRLSYLKWLNDDEVKIYKGCGSSCLVSYVVNTNTKQVSEFVEKVIE